MADDATEQELTFDVEGMSCAACSRRVEKALGKVEGVKEARVDLVRERAIVVLRGPAARVGAEAESAVERAGYKLRLRAGAAPPNVPTERERRTPIAWALTIAALVAAALGQPWVELGLASVAVLGAGAPIFHKAFTDLRAREAGMDVLIAVGAGASLASALLASILGAAEHATHAMHSMQAMGAMADASHGAMAHSDASMAALVVSVALLGKTLERRAKTRAADAIEAIVRAMPETARIVRHGVEGEVAIGEVREGDEVHVAPFARVPVDGELLPIEGVSDDGASLDESVITGESRPVTRRIGERVLGGAINLGRALRLRATSAGEGSELAKVIAAVSRAAAEKSPIVRTTDRIAAVFAPVVLAAAAITLIGWLAAGADSTSALRLAISVVVVACPCALGLATPVAVTVALGHLASLGVLVRDAGILEILPRVRTLVLDKTGTLTRGVPRVIAVRLAREAEWSEDEVLARAASVESDSHHPLARAIFEEAMRRRLVVPRAKAIEEIAGHGVRGRIDDELVDVTRPSAANDGAFEPLEDDAVSVVEVCSAGRAVARLSFEDALREEASEVVGTLRARGITLVIRSGDAPGAVARVASVLGIEDARGGLAPADKLTGLAPAARPLAMIGDGVNDAPALAEADVGFALGTRTEAALSAAGIALPRADLRLVVATHDLARRTVRVIRENLALAFAYNTLAIPFAALGAFDRIGGPAAAAIAMSLSSLLVVLNALRLRAGSGVMSRP